MKNSLLLIFHCANWLDEPLFLKDYGEVSDLKAFKTKPRLFVKFRKKFVDYKRFCEHPWQHFKRRLPERQVERCVFDFEMMSFVLYRREEARKEFSYVFKHDILQWVYFGYLEYVSCLHTG